MYKEPRQAKVAYVNCLTDKNGDIYDIRTNDSTLYLNNKMSAVIKFNDLDFDTNLIMFREEDINTGSISDFKEYKEFIDEAFEDGHYSPEENTILHIYDITHEISTSIKIINI